MAACQMGTRWETAKHGWAEEVSENGTKGPKAAFHTHCFKWQWYKATGENYSVSQCVSNGDLHVNKWMPRSNILNVKRTQRGECATTKTFIQFSMNRIHHNNNISTTKIHTQPSRCSYWTRTSTISCVSLHKWSSSHRISPTEYAF